MKSHEIQRDFIVIFGYNLYMFVVFSVATVGVVRVPLLGPARILFEAFRKNALAPALLGPCWTNLFQIYRQH